MYPKNAASPEKIAIGPVVQISDGAVQTSGCTVRIITSGDAEADGGGTTAYSTDGIVLYTPTQAESNHASFILIAKKSGCIPASVTVVPTLSAVAGQAVCADTQKVDVETIKTQAITCAAGVTVLASVGAPAAPGASGGLPTTNGTKLNQTVDLTAGQSIACSDKTGFSLSSTGADLILKSSTFVQAIVAAINEFATYGLTALNTLLVTTGIKAATIPNATIGGYATGQDPATLLLVTPANKINTDAANAVKIQKMAVTLAAGDVSGNLPAEVKAQDNIDFGALQKTSLNAATPASVQNIPVDGSFPVALRNGAHGGVAAVITLQTPIEANVASETNHDFTALQKTSLNAATPASVQNVPVDGTLKVSVNGYETGKTPLQPIVAGRTIDVAADGSVNAGEVSVTGEVTLAALQPNYAPAKAGDAMALTSGERTSTATAVWASTTRTLSSFGTLLADIWGYATRTLTAFGFTVPATVADKTGYALTSAYDPAKTAAQASDIPTATITAINAKTTNLPSDPADQSLLIAATNQIRADIAAIPAGGGGDATLAKQEEILATLALISGGVAGSGAISWTINITVGGVPKDGVEVWATTDILGVSVVASGVTDAFGDVTFMLDAGTYYAWCQEAGINFTNPTSFVVS